MTLLKHVFLLLVTIAVANAEFCDMIKPDLPDSCNCTEGSTSLNMSCTVDMLDVDTLGFSANLAPCGKPASLTLRVTEADEGIDWSTQYDSGESGEVPVPDLSIDVPIFGSAGVYAVYEIDGDASALGIALGLDACGTVLGITKCGSSVTSELPIILLNNTYKFEKKKKIIINIIIIITKTKKS